MDASNGIRVRSAFDESYYFYKMESYYMGTFGGNKYLELFNLPKYVGRR